MSDLREYLDSDELQRVVGRPVLDGMLLGRVAASILTGTSYDAAGPAIERDARLLVVAASVFRLV